MKIKKEAERFFVSLRALKGRSNLFKKIASSPAAPRKDTYKAQTSLELTVALIVAMIFFVGSVKIFVWLNDRIVRRQVAYENSRVSAANIPMAAVPGVGSGDDLTTDNLRLPNEVVADESTYPQLNIFEKSN